MRATSTPILVIMVAGLLVFLLGCGGNASPAPTATPAPTPTASPAPTPTAGSGSTTPPSTPPPPGSGGTGTPSPSANSETVWQATLIGWSDLAVHGQVTVDADGHTGNGTYKFSGAASGSSYTFRFCMGFASASDCFDIQTGTADSNGSGSGSFHFVPPARWGAVQSSYEGVFLVDIAGQRWGVTSWSPSTADSAFTAQLFNDTTATATSGRVTVNGGTVHVHVVGAKPSTTYEVGQQDTINSHSGHLLGTLTTDSSGNADADFHSDQPGWTITFGLPSGSATTDNYLSGFAIK